MKIDKINTHINNKQYNNNYSRTVSPAFKMNLNRTISKNTNKSIFSGMVDSFKDTINNGIDTIKSGIAKGKEVVADIQTKAKTTITKAQATIENIVDTTIVKVQTIVEYPKELLEKQQEVLALITVYKSLEEETDEKLALFKDLRILSLSELNKLAFKLREEISYKQMVKGLKKHFRKGTSHYIDHDPKFNPQNLDNIQAQKNLSYEQNLQNMCAAFLQNSQKIDAGLSDFNGLSRQFFFEAAESIKEIFDLQTNTANKWLERIPKLGIIPKALRVNDQIKLTNYIIDDYKDVTHLYVKNQFVPFMNSYKQQSDIIHNYVQNHKFKAFFYRKTTKTILEKIDNAKKQRLKANAVLLKTYSQNGLNMTNMCKNIKKKGIIELATKTAFTFLSCF